MTDINRRKFITIAGKTAALIPVVSLLPATASLAADIPLVDVESAQAKALKYVAKSETEGQSCGSCALYAGGDAARGGCPLFQGAEVTIESWCSAYAPKG